MARRRRSRAADAERALVQASYTSSAVAAFVSNPQNGVAGLQALATKLGGRLEMLEFCLSDYDIVGIITLANDTTATAPSPGRRRGRASEDLQDHAPHVR